MGAKGWERMPDVQAGLLLCTGYIHIHYVTLNIGPEIFHWKQLRSSDPDSTKTSEVPAVTALSRLVPWLPALSQSVLPKVTESHRLEMSHLTFRCNPCDPAWLGCQSSSCLTPPDGVSSPSWLRGSCREGAGGGEAEQGRLCRLRKKGALGIWNCLFQMTSVSFFWRKPSLSTWWTLSDVGRKKDILSCSICCMTKKVKHPGLLLFGYNG